VVPMGGRGVTAKSTSLPNFVMIGPGRVGSTSVSQYLRQHPKIYVSPTKEPRFFAYDQVRPTHGGPDGAKCNADVVWNLDEYRALFSGADDIALLEELTERDWSRWFEP
jgi:hypothetical protein